MTATPIAIPPRPRLHRLKTDPEVYQAVLSGCKTFEIRLNDRGFRVGDELLLMETVTTGEAIRAGAPLQFTGNELRKHVSHVLRGYGLMPGWVCLSFAEADRSRAAQGEPVAQELPSEERERILKAAALVMPHANPLIWQDWWEGHAVHTEADDIVAIWKAAASPAPQATGVLSEMLAAFNAYDAIHWGDVAKKDAARAAFRAALSPAKREAEPATMTHFRWTFPERFTSTCWLDVVATKESLTAYHAGVDAEKHVDFSFCLDGEQFDVSFDELVSALRAAKG